MKSESDVPHVGKLPPIRSNGRSVVTDWPSVVPARSAAGEFCCEFEVGSGRSVSCAIHSADQSDASSRPVSNQVGALQRPAWPVTSQAMTFQ